MGTVISDRLRDSYQSAKSQFGELQDKAAHSISDIREQVTEVPEQLRGTWGRVIHRIWLALDVPTRQEYRALARRLDAIERKLGGKTGARAAKRSTKK